MTALGWFLMTVSVGSVVTLTVYCFWRVLAAPKAKGHLHAPLEIETDEPLE
ncbi:MAG TPA: hypothetical protein VL049_22730 [Candidatus Dormibacteraeota bacterium]|nr:hypothetical protein [Candidatus Dormibacteraeota bacterium]